MHLHENRLIYTNVRTTARQQAHKGDAFHLEACWRFVIFNDALVEHDALAWDLVPDGTEGLVQAPVDVSE